jgi:hypothetical protein
VARSLRNGVAAQGLPVARLKVGQCDTSPWGSQRLSSTSSPTGVLRPGYAQLPGIGWECSRGGHSLRRGWRCSGGPAISSGGVSERALRRSGEGVRGVRWLPPVPTAGLSSSLFFLFCDLLLIDCNTRGLSLLMVGPTCNTKWRHISRTQIVDGPYNKDPTVKTSGSRGVYNKFHTHF